MRLHPKTRISGHSPLLICTLALLLCATPALAGDLAPGVFTFPGGPSTSDDTAEITILHTSDLHGYGFLREIFSPEQDAYSGGLFSLATLIEKKRRALGLQGDRGKGKDDAILLIDAGDAVSGTYNDSLRQGADMTTVMNSPILDYDAKTIGNHSVDYGTDPMYRNIGKTKFPVVVANAVDKETGEPMRGTVPYTVTEYQGVRIGLIGLTHPRSTRIDGVKCTHPVKALKRYLPELREKADVVICIAHIGLEREKAWQKAIAEMDEDPKMNVELFVDGHSHADIQFSIDEDTLVVQAGHYGTRCGELRMRYDKARGAVTDIEIIKHSLETTNASPSAKLTGAFEALVAQVKTENEGVVVAGLDGFFQKKTSRSAPYLSNPACDFLARSFLEVDLGTKGIVPDVGMCYQRSVRNHVAANDQGQVTNDIIHRVVPFPERVVAVRVRGAKLLEIVGKGVQKKYSWSGLQVRVLERIEGNELIERKLESVEIYDREEQAYVSVDPKKDYWIGCVSFFARVFIRPAPGATVKGKLDAKQLLAAFLVKYSQNQSSYFTEIDALGQPLVVNTGE